MAGLAALATVAGEEIRDAGVVEYVLRLRHDARLAEELAFCRSAGIPHSHFLGGRLRWSDSDQDKALAFERYRRLACFGCGTFPDEWLDPTTGRTVADPPYIAEAVRCYGCAERDAVAGEIRKAGGDLDGISVRLRPFDPARDEEDE